MRLPRFGLRSLVIFAVLFCLLFGFVGRNFVRMREEDAAIESLKQVGATVYVARGDELARHPGTSALEEATNWRNLPSLASRLLGRSDRTSVREVDLSSDRTDREKLDQALAALAVFQRIESIALSGKLFTDDSLKPLSALPNLKSLELAGTSIDAEGLAEVPSPERFRSLSLIRQKRRMPLLPGVAALEELRWMQVADSDLTRADMQGIASLPKLETLRLLYVTPSERDVFAPLAGAQRLTELTIEASAFEDADVDAIASLPNLERLWIDGSLLTDSGFAKLDSLQRLRVVVVTEPVTEAAVRAFAEARPDAIVTYRTLGSARHFQGAEELAPAAARKFFEANGVSRDESR